MHAHHPVLSITWYRPRRPHMHAHHSVLSITWYRPRRQWCSAACCCCCHDEPVRQFLYGGTDVPKRWEIPPDSESGGIRLSLVIVDSHFINWGTTQGRLSLPTADVLSTIVKRSMLTDVDKLPSCSWFSDSAAEKCKPWLYVTESYIYTYCWVDTSSIESQNLCITVSYYSGVLYYILLQISWLLTTMYSSCIRSVL